MVDVVVFGTGSNGERAWRAAAERPDINVVCFADNDPGKHGTRFHGRNIVRPDALANESWDFIVLASMYAPDMARQLRNLGVSSDAVVDADPNTFEAVFAALPARKQDRSVTTPGRARTDGLVPLAGSERVASARLEDVLTDRVHYACGRNVLEGWLNLDGYDESFPSGEVPAEIAGRIYRLDLTGAHPFPDNYFRLGYSEDFVEHITQAEFVSFLCECYRTFAPGGVLRLSSPGLEGILRRHLRGSDWQAAAVLREEAYTRWWHKHFLCLPVVDAIARHIGWREVRSVPYGESDIPDLRQETRPQQADLNLVVELVK